MLRDNARAFVLTSTPATTALPLVGASSPVSILMVVVLPAPFGPRNPKISPDCTLKLTAFTAVKSPNVLDSPSTLIHCIIAYPDTFLAEMQRQQRSRGPPARYPSLLAAQSFVSQLPPR